MRAQTTLTPAQKQAQQVASQVKNLQRSQFGDLKVEHQVSEETKNALNYDSTKAKDAVNEGWANYLSNPFIQAPAKIEYAPQPQPASQTLENFNVDDTQEKIAQLQKILQVEQKEVAHAEAKVLEAMAPKEEFTAGSLDFSQNNELNTPTPEVFTTLGLEPKLPVEHQEQSRVDLKTETVHHDDIDFKYFFDTTGGWVKEGLETASSFILKKTLNVKSWGEAKSAIWDQLLWKDILGLGQTKELTPEQKQKQQTQAANKRSFYDALRSGAKSLFSSEQRRALRERVANINKSLKRGNLSYEGILDSNGQINEAIMTEAEKANSQKSEQELQAEKRRKLAMAAKPMVKKGPGITVSADKAHNFNNAAKLAG